MSSFSTLLVAPPASEFMEVRQAHIPMARLNATIILNNENVVFLLVVVKEIRLTTGSARVFALV